jgi:hypothetical protein
MKTLYVLSRYYFVAKVITPLLWIWMPKRLRIAICLWATLVITETFIWKLEKHIRKRDS